MNGQTDRAGAARLIDHVVGAIEAAPLSQAPFVHLALASVFPGETYREMVTQMPDATDYIALPGRGGVNLKADGTSTRVKIDLFPERTRHLPARKRGVWTVVGRALSSREVRDAFMRRLAPGLARRFGDKAARVGMYPIASLTRDVPGYEIPPHTDTHWKGITVQLYLPRDDAHAAIGTIMHGLDGDGKLTRERQMPFVPNSGYAFAVADNTWHSADRVGEAVSTRDSILLTYYVDDTPLRKIRNRIKRAGNFLLHEARSLTR